MALTRQQKLDNDKHAVETALGSLRALAPELNQARDDLGATFDAVTQELKKLNLGVSGWVKMAEGGSGLQRTRRELGYSKFGSHGWCLTVRMIRGDIDDLSVCEIEQWDLNNSPTLMRLEAVAHIPTLLLHLAKNGENLIQQLRSAKGRLTPMLEQLSGGTDAG